MASSCGRAWRANSALVMKNMTRHAGIPRDLGFGTHAWMNKGSSEAISGAKQLQYLHIKVSESGGAHKLEPPICCRT